MNTLKSLLEYAHVPVLLSEVIKLCSPHKGGNFLDCTFGGGGYTKALLDLPETNVSALDRDKFVITYANDLKKKFPNRFNFFHEKFSNLDKINFEKKFDVIIFDLGLSSFQLQDLSRGFSFKSKDKLDMKMGLSNLTAAEVINDFKEDSLKRVLKILGEKHEASKIVKNIIKKRENKKISNTNELVDIIEKKKKKNYKKKINASTKTFQALRIFVNKEITELIEGIIKSTNLLKPDGKLIIVTFHSIEDKIVKYYFKNYSSNRSNPSRYMPETKQNNLNLFENYKNKTIQAQNLEVKKNPQSRSAKLRYATRSKNTFYIPKDLKLKFEKYLKLEKNYA